jgi:hypothetical protein
LKFAHKPAILQQVALDLQIVIRKGPQAANATSNSGLPKRKTTVANSSLKIILIALLVAVRVQHRMMALGLFARAVAPLILKVLVQSMRTCMSSLQSTTQVVAKQIQLMVSWLLHPGAQRINVIVLFSPMSTSARVS